MRDLVVHRCVARSACDRSGAAGSVGWRRKGDGRQRLRAKDALGAYGEQVAAAHLVAAGMTVLDRNWRCDIGEIDIVARDGDVLVVCEVKTRSVDGVRAPARGGHRAQGRPAAAARGARGSTERQVHPPDVRIDVVGRAAAAARRGRGRARAGGGLSDARADPGASRWSGVEGHLVEVEADLAPGCRRSAWSGCPTRR